MRFLKFLTSSGTFFPDPEPPPGGRPPPAPAPVPEALAPDCEAGDVAVAVVFPLAVVEDLFEAGAFPAFSGVFLGAS